MSDPGSQSEAIERGDKMSFREFIEYDYVPNLRRRQAKPSTLASYASMLERHVYPQCAGEEVGSLRDGKWRPIEPRLMPMANGVSKRMGCAERSLGWACASAFLFRAA